MPSKDPIRTPEEDGLLLPYQLRWTMDKSPVKVIEKSRRIGISWAEASDDALYAAHAGGGDVWYIGYNLDMAREFMQDCEHWSRQKAIAAFRIRFASGHRITALSGRPTNLRGKQGRVVIDEAAFHNDLEELIKAAMALLMWGGGVRIISTHNGEDNPFFDLVREIREGKKHYSLHRVDLDGSLEEGLYKKICQTLGREWSPQAEAGWRQKLVGFYGDGAQEELFCVPSRGGGVFLTRALIESCMDPDIPVLRLACPEGFAERPESERKSRTEAWCEDHILPVLEKLDPALDHCFGEDFGRTGDLTVLTPLSRLKDGTLRAPFVAELRNAPFMQQRQVVFFILDRLPRFRSGAFDARGNGQFLAEVSMQRYGSSRIHQVMPTAQWYREHMPRYRAAFEDRTIVLPRDPDILDDHRALRVEKGVAKVPEGYTGKGRDGGRRHGDAAMSGAMGVYADHVDEYAPIAYTSVEKRRLVFGDGAW
jgi:phage FluMu gp28-like protein